ncbi:MAG: TraB/GumN family protein [Pseudomonadales bacterium]
MFRRNSLLSGCLVLLCSLSLAAQSTLAQQPAAVPQKTPPVTHSAAALAVDGEKIATGQSSAAANPLMAVVDAIQKCEQQRVAKKIVAACEPVRVDKENIASAAELRDKAQQQPAALSLFELKGRRSKVYLFGSVHLMKKNMYPLHSAIIERFEGADNLVVEINTDAIPAQQLQEEFTRRGTLPAGSSLSERLSPTTLSQVKQVLAARGYGIQAFQHMQPWFFEQTFVAQEMLVYGYDPGAGIDSYLIKLAKESGKPVLELETLEQQLDMLSTASATEQDLSMRHTFELLAEESVQSDLNRLVVDWLRGDVDRMYRYMSEPVKDFPELNTYITRLLDDRNAQMAKKIRRWLRGKGSYFVVVGAGHLGGPKGLVKLLEKKGFKIEQIQR